MSHRVAADYTAALGQAVYAFAELEWLAIQHCERMEPGSIAALSDRTAGRVADTLRILAVRRGDGELTKAAERFQALVRSRNNLLHAKPDVDSDGAARLFRDGDPWTQGEIEQIAAAFAASSAVLSTLFRSQLSKR